MRFWLMFFVSLGIFLILRGAFHTAQWSPQWWSFFLGSLCIGAAVSTIGGRK